MPPLEKIWSHLLYVNFHSNNSSHVVFKCFRIQFLYMRMSVCESSNKGLETDYYMFRMLSQNDGIYINYVVMPILFALPRYALSLPFHHVMSSGKFS